MHIPDGLMSPAMAAIGWVLALIMIALTIRILDGRVDDRQMTLMAILSAGIFVAQMLNFPIGGGTSGHLLGAAFAAILLGPFAATLIITVILIIQALMFGDGGITALGLNIINMAVAGSFTAWFVFRLFPKRFGVPGMFAAAWSAVMAGAALCSLELAISYSVTGGAYGIAGEIAFPAMLGYHVLIGIGEGIITTGMVTFISQVSPDMLAIPKITLRGTGGVVDA